MSTVVTPHDVLGIEPDATLDDAEAAYYRLLMVHHPDLHQTGGPDAVAAAEARTRALNLAITQLRARSGGAGATASTRAAPGPGATGPEAPEPSPTDAEPGPSATGPSATGPDGADGLTDDDAAPGSWQDPDPVVYASCPFCGSPFAAAPALKRHVADAHGVRMDLRPGRRRRSSRVGNALRRWQYVSIWYLLPLNLLAALILGVAVAPLDPYFGFWVFGVAMAPSCILVVTRGFGPRA